MSDLPPGSKSLGAQEMAGGEVAAVDAEVTLLLFVAGGELHAVPLDEVEAVARAGEVRTVPQPPPHVVGVIDRHDEPIPVVNLAEVLELPPGAAKHVLVHRSRAGVVGFLVEEARGVAKGGLRPVPPQLRRPGGALIGLADVGAETAYLLDLEAGLPADFHPSRSA